MSSKSLVTDQLLWSVTDIINMLTYGPLASTESLKD